MPPFLWTGSLSFPRAMDTACVYHEVVFSTSMGSCGSKCTSLFVRFIGRLSEQLVGNELHFCLSLWHVSCGDTYLCHWMLHEHGSTLSPWPTY